MTKVRAAIAVGALMCLAGCSMAAPGGSGTGQGPSDTSDTLHLNFEETPYFDAVVDEFVRQHPNIDVKVTNSPLSFEDGSIQTHLRSGQGADVVLVNSGPGRVGTLAAGGLIANLDDFFDADDHRGRYSEEIIDQTTGEDGIFEVVEGRDIFQLYYNVELFEAAGIEPPDTWQDLIASCGPLAASGVQPLTVGARDNFAGGWLLGALVQSAAGEETIRDILFAEGSFDDPSVIEGGQMLTDLIDAGCVNPTEGLALDFTQAGVSFAERDAAMVVGTQATIPDQEQDGYDTTSIMAMPMPSDDEANERPTSGLALSWIVNAETDSFSNAEAWLDWVSSEEYLALAVENGMGLAPARLVPESVELDPNVQQAVDAVEEGTGYNPSVYLPATTKEAWYAAIQGLLSGNDDSETLMGAVQQDLQGARENEGD